MSGSWEDFEREQTPPQPRNTRLDELCAQVFTAAGGRDLLDLLHKQFVDRRGPATVPEAMLRDAESRRQMVLELEAARDRGLKILTERKQKQAAET